MSPPVIPYLPQYIENQAELIQEIKNEHKQYETKSFMDSSLYEDSSLEQSKEPTQDDHIQKELDRIREWAEDLNEFD